MISSFDVRRDSEYKNELSPLYFQFLKFFFPSETIGPVHVISYQESQEPNSDICINDYI